MSTTSKKRILIVSHYYPPHHGGIEIVASTQAEHLAAAGYKVTVVTSQVIAGEYNIRKKNLRVLRVKAWNGLEKIKAPFPVFSPRIWSVLYRETNRADIIHIHDAFYLNSFVAAVCARLHKKPIVLTQHVALVAHPSKFVIWLQRAVYATSGRFIFNSSKLILTLNDRVALFLRVHGVSDDKLRNSINGIDTEHFKPVTALQKAGARQKLGLPNNKKIILFLGRLVQKKGFEKVLAAASDDYFLVFGGGPVSKSMVDSNKMKFLGPVPSTETAEVYAAADVYVLPSEDEGFPLTLQEAMASGLPVITSDDPGYVRYKIDHTRMKLISPSSATVKRAINEVLSLSPSQRQKMSAYSRDYANRHFAWKKVMSDLEQIYQEASAA